MVTRRSAETIVGSVPAESSRSACDVSQFWQ
jgi:hypothetical protein